MNDIMRGRECDFQMRFPFYETTRRLSDNWDRSEENGGRSQIFTDLRDNSGPIAGESGEIWGVIPLSAVDRHLSDSLLGQY